MEILNKSLTNYGLINNIKSKDKNAPFNNKPTENNISFKQILEDKTDKNRILFSKHASTRLNDRNLSLTSAQIKRIENGIKKAEQKGIKDSLVLVDNIALLVNVRNKIVVTAIDNKNDNVYTNIDGAVIV